ncbi:MAG: hypothetical protein ACRD2R_05755, partial [Terriglobales bacterium]
GLNAELVFVRHVFPMGEKGLTIRPGGVVTPADAELRRLLMKNGLAAKPGDRARITSVEIKGSRLLFEINGGPKKKKKWYQRIEISGAGGSSPVAGQPAEFSPGSVVALEFPNYVPELSVDEVRELLSPVLDFSSTSAAEAYLDTVPPKVREAIRNHEALVGMNREMVIYAKGRPPRKIREREHDLDYEEWIYGDPPQDVEFIRFVGDEVVQVKIMKMAGEKIVRTEKEVEVTPEGTTVVSGSGAEEAQPAARPGRKPSLHRPGEAPEDPPASASDGPILIPDRGPVDPSGEPQPGTPPPRHFLRGSDLRHLASAGGRITLEE